MTGKYDHFHATYEYEGKQGEIEGGWTGYPDNWNNMSAKDQADWLDQLCINWGVPRGAKVTRLWLAG